MLYVVSICLLRAGCAGVFVSHPFDTVKVGTEIYVYSQLAIYINFYFFSGTTPDPRDERNASEIHGNSALFHRHTEDGRSEFFNRVVGSAFTLNVRLGLIFNCRLVT